MNHRSTNPGDIVLIHLYARPASFARVEAVRPHDRHGWYYCDLLVLAVPPQPVSWILERTQIDGAEFTMGGRPVRIERIPDMGALHAGPCDRSIANDESPARTVAKVTVAGSSPATAKVAAPRATLKTARVAKPKPTREIDSNVVRLFPRKSPA